VRSLHMAINGSFHVIQILFKYVMGNSALICISVFPFVSTFSDLENASSNFVYHIMEFTLTGLG